MIDLIKHNLDTTETPCAQCPWRVANHGKRHRRGFYRKDNLRRLWNQIRNGGQAQSCHLTDPSHPDHIENGCKPDSKPKECMGSVILVARELEVLKSFCSTPDKNDVDDVAITRYLNITVFRRGLRKNGLCYFLFQRISLSAPALPNPGAMIHDAAFGRADEPERDRLTETATPNQPISPPGQCPP